MGVGRKPIAVLLMGETHVVAARFAAEGARPRCGDIARVAIEDAGVPGALKRLAATKTVKGAEVRVVLPRHRVTTRVVSLPSTDPGEIARMVRIEADRYVPYPIEELVLDHTVLSTSVEGFATVLVVLVRRDDVNAALAPLRAARVKDISATVSSLALYNAYLASGPANDVHIGAVHVGVGGLDVIAVEDGELAFMRGVPWSGEWRALEAVTEAAGEDIVREVRASVDSRRRTVPGATPLSKLYLSGEVAGMEGLRDRMAAELDIEVELLDDISEGSSAPGAVAAGAVVPPSKVAGGITVNLVPEEYTAGVSRTAQRKRLAVVAVLVMAAMLVATRISRERAEANAKYLEYLKGEIAKVEPVRKLVQTKQQRVRAVHSRLNRGFTVLEFMARVHELAPDDMVFESFEFASGSHATIEAMAREGGIPFTYADKLRRSGIEYLQRAESGSSSVSSQRGQTVIVFEVLVPFAADPESSDADEEEQRLDEQT
jgi:hypothetical protein